jgi:hypothetical protein
VTVYSFNVMLERQHGVEESLGLAATGNPSLMSDEMVRIPRPMESPGFSSAVILNVLFLHINTPRQPISMDNLRPGQSATAALSEQSHGHGKAQRSASLSSYSVLIARTMPISTYAILIARVGIHLV